MLSPVWSRVGEQESDDGSAQFDVSPQGILVYRTDPGGQFSSIKVADVASGGVTRIGEPGAINWLEVSRDGRFLASRVSGEGSSEIHLQNLESGGRMRFTFGDGIVRIGCWADGSETFLWTRTSRDRTVLYSRPTDGSQPPKEIYGDDVLFFPTSVSPDGQWLLLSLWVGGRSSEAGPLHGDEWGICRLSLTEPGAKPEILVDTTGSQNYGRFSPDGRWFTYHSNEGDSWGVYLRRFPDTGAKWRLTGGHQFLSHEWVADGSGVLVHNSVETIRIGIELCEESPRIGQPVPIVDEGVVPRAAATGQTAFAPDGSKIYFISRDRPANEDDRIVLVADWLSELRELAPR